jgi:hypothetical protein
MAGQLATASQISNAARVPLVSSEVSRLASVVDHLTSLCENIESRFSAVVRQVPPQTTAGRDRGLIDKNPESVPLANNLRELNERLESVAQRFQIMLENTEL